MSSLGFVFLGFVVAVGCLAATAWWFPYTLSVLAACGVFIGYHMADLLG